MPPVRVCQWCWLEYICSSLLDPSHVGKEVSIMESSLQIYLSIAGMLLALLVSRTSSMPPHAMIDTLRMTKPIGDSSSRTIPSTQRSSVPTQVTSTVVKESSPSVPPPPQPSDSSNVAEDLNYILNNDILKKMITGVSEQVDQARELSMLSNLIFPGKSSTCTDQSSSCFVITLKKSPSGSVSRAILFVWKMSRMGGGEEDGGSLRHTHTLVVKQVDSPSRPTKETVQNSEIRIEVNDTTSGWIKIDVTKIASEWYTTGQNETVIIAISCPNCSQLYSPVSQEKDQLPFMVVRSMEELKDRHKRSTGAGDCTSGSGTNQCCRASRNVTTDELGWQYVATPTSFEFFYCRGSCAPTMETFENGRSTNHLDVLDRVRSISTDIPEREALTACCAPTSYSPISFIYNETGTIYVKQYTDLIVQTCGCS